MTRPNSHPRTSSEQLAPPSGIVDLIEKYLERQKALEIAETRLAVADTEEDIRVAELNVAAMRNVVADYERIYGMGGDEPTPRP